jgi:integrase
MLADMLFGMPFGMVDGMTVFIPKGMALGFPGYSAHGLRHLAGAALAEVGASVHEIMSILGHVTEAQAMEYTRQANRKVMAVSAMAKWDGTNDDKQ